MPVYIHSRIAIEGGARGKMIELVRQRLGLHLEKSHGVRLAGLWATVGSTGEWPEVRVHWEMDDWSHFARAQAEQFPMEDRDLFLNELWHQALDYRQAGHSALLSPAPFSPDLAAVRNAGITGEVVLLEDFQARPGCLDDYQAALGGEGVPLAEKRGLRLIGSYVHALNPNSGMNLWQLRDWDHWSTLMREDSSDACGRAWTQRSAQWLADIDGFLMVPPPAGALRT